MDLNKTLRDTEPFNRLPDDLFAEFGQAAILKTFPPDTPIFNQHDPPTGYLYVIKQGLVEIVVTTPGGGQMVVDYRRDGSFFGGTPVFTDEEYTAGARAVKATECYLIPAALLVKAAKRYPHIAEYFTRAIFSRVRSLYSDMVTEHAESSLGQMDAYPFKKRLSEIMSSPAEFCSPSTGVTEIARTLVKKGIGAILVCDDLRHPVGIITERDLVAKVLASDDPESFAATAAEVMTPNPRTMAPDTYMFEATTFMVRHKIRHLPVVDEGELVGIVSLQELMKFRSQKSLLLMGSIKEARSVADLADIKGEIIKVAKSLMSEARSQIETMEILSSIHHGILRCGFDLVLEEMRQRGMSPPDVKYCFIVMGSGGRKEMLLDPDQDNGLIFENYPEDKAAVVEAFFVPFLERLIQAYAEIGYPLCNGGVMASNPFWRGRLKDWEAKVANWVNAPEPQRVRYSTIFFDFMPLMGDPSLGQKLRRIVDREIRQFPLFLHFMMNLDYKHKVPLNLLGRFSLEREKEHRGTLSLKQTGSIFIVDCIRMFMLEKQIYAPTTIERLDLLVKMKAFNSETAEHIKAAFEAFTFLRLRNEIALIEKGRAPSHYLDPYALTNAEQELLREAFRAASKLQDSTKRHFNVG